jgi:3-phenylpropionate/trans-cinnamate dioxygenase ferredoxin reductase subunit
VTLLGAEARAPYTRPPLSKELLAGSVDPSYCMLASREELARRDITVREATPAVGLDGRRKTIDVITPNDGAPVVDQIAFDTAVITTGVSPRTPFAAADGAGVFRLRTIDDAVALRTAAVAAGEIVIIGSGLVGTEVAATLTSCGVAVTLIGRPSGPLGYLHPVVGELLTRVHEQHGVRLISDRRARGIEYEKGTAVGVRMSDGTIVPGRCSLLSVAAEPVTGWLSGSGVALDDGVICDLRSRAAPNIYAAGDVARRRGPGVDVRLENQQNAVEHGIFVGESIVGSAAEYRPMPYGWTYQYEVQLQMVGTTRGARRSAIVADSMHDGRFLIVFGSEDTISGAIGWNAASHIRRARKWIREPRPWHDVESVPVPSASELVPK